MLNRPSSQNMKSAVQPYAMSDDEAVRTAFISMQLVAYSWPAVLDFHSAMLLVAEFDRMRTAAQASAQDTHAFPLNNDVVQPGRTPAPGAGGFRWLTSLKQAVLSLHAYWQREREVRKAVAALSEFNDWTLRDMGIVSRTEIEHAVRYRRDR